MAGETSALLWEEPVGWAITRGTTKGESKFIPMTPTDLRMRISAGRAMMNFVATTQRFDLFAGVNLNLNFPSVVGTVKVGERQLEYGYSSGIYTKHVSTFTPIRSVPTQDEIDALGGGKSDRRIGSNASSWPTRSAKTRTSPWWAASAPRRCALARYLHQAHKVYPKDLWKTQIMTLGSVAGINTKYAASPARPVWPAAIREIYGATEGMFGQQMDEKRAWTPNYDLFFFEVHDRRGHQNAARDAPRRDGRAGGLHADPAALPHRRPDPGLQAALFPLHRARRMVDAVEVRLGRAVHASI